MYIDLHVHTTASDGQYTPTEIISKAKALGLEKIAITDHDTVDGIAEAKLAASELGVEFIPGIEVSTQDTEEVHILGLNIDYENPELVETCRVYAESRAKRAEKICEYLGTKRIKVLLEDVQKIAGDGVIGRPHFAQYLQEQGHVKSCDEAFRKYLNTKEFNKYTERKKPTPEEAIALIHKAGGKAFLAHPGVLKMGWKEVELLIERLKAVGLDGIECYYSRHTKPQIERFLELAEKYDLQVSAGSDFHGEKIKPDIKLGYEFCV